MKARKPDVPGEMGRPVVIGDDRQAEMKEQFKVNQFNILASDLISPNRSLPDVRMDAYVLLFCTVSIRARTSRAGFNGGPGPQASHQTLHIFSFMIMCVSCIFNL